MEAKYAPNFKPKVDALGSNPCVNNNEDFCSERKPNSRLLNIFINVFRPMIERELNKFQTKDMSSTSSAEIKATVDDSSSPFEPNLVYELKKLEQAIEMSDYDTKRVMNLYLSGKSICEIGKQLSIKKLSIINHIRLFQLNTKL